MRTAHDSTSQGSEKRAKTEPPPPPPPPPQPPLPVDLEVYRSKYNNLSIEELQRIRDTSSSESVLEFAARAIHNSRERVKIKGKPALRPQPLLQVLSVSVQLNDGDGNENKSLSIYGNIHAEYLDCGSIIFHKLYDCERSNAEILSSNENGNLTLIGPDCDANQPEYEACIPLFRSRIKVMLYDGADDNVFANQCFCLDDEIDADDPYDCVKTKSIDCESGSLTFKYIAIPFGVICRVEVRFSNNDRQVSKKHEFADVSGKVVARYGNNNCGNYSNSEEHERERECVVLFETRENECKRVEFDEKKILHLSRCWVTLPAYSSLTIGVNLSDFQTKEHIVNDSVEFIPQQGWLSNSYFVSMSGDIIVSVCAVWFSPKPMGQCNPNGDYHFLPSQPLREIQKKDVEEGVSTEEVEMMDTEVKIESSDDDESDDSSNLNLLGSLRPHRIMPLSSPAVEIFSVFIGRENTKAMKIHGLIDVLSDDRGICNIFKRNEDDALILAEGVKSLPIPDGSRVFEDFSSLEMKFDIKDSEGRSTIKGFVDWAASVLETSSWHDKQLCSFIQGVNGFAAIHYSIFSEAVGAYARVFLTFKSGDIDVHPVICGSVIAEYSCYDYSSRYNKNYFRNVLVRKTHDDPIQVGVDSSIALSRSTVVVPTYSSLLVYVDLDLEVSSQKFLCAEKIQFEIGEVCKTVETEECSIRIELDWCEVK